MYIFPMYRSPLYFFGSSILFTSQEEDRIYRMNPKTNDDYRELTGSELEKLRAQIKRDEDMGIIEMDWYGIAQMLKLPLRSVRRHGEEIEKADKDKGNLKDKDKDRDKEKDEDKDKEKYKVKDKDRDREKDEDKDKEEYKVKDKKTEQKKRKREIEPSASTTSDFDVDTMLAAAFTNQESYKGVDLNEQAKLRTEWNTKNAKGTQKRRLGWEADVEWYRGRITGTKTGSDGELLYICSFETPTPSELEFQRGQVVECIKVYSDLRLQNYWVDTPMLGTKVLFIDVTAVLRGRKTNSHEGIVTNVETTKGVTSYQCTFETPEPTSTWFGETRTKDMAQAYLNRHVRLEDPSRGVLQAKSAPPIPSTSRTPLFRNTDHVSCWINSLMHVIFLALPLLLSFLSSYYMLCQSCEISWHTNPLLNLNSSFSR